MILSGKRSQHFEKNNKGATLVFVYATLMHPRSRDLAFHHKARAEKASVVGYKKEPFTTKEGHDFENIERSGTGELHGDVLSLGPEDLAKLKVWEDQYHLIPVTLKDGRQAHAFQLNKDAEIKKE